MDIIHLLVIAISIVTVSLIVENVVESIQAQTPITTSRLTTIINETNSNSTVDVLNKTLPSENTTRVVPVVPM